LTTLQQKDGWWEGILDGYVGFFYSSFVEEIQYDVEAPQAKAPVITHAPSLRKKAGGTGFEVPVPKISLGDITDQDFDGWLWKEGNKKVWKKQWFVLKEFCLYFFENNKYDSPALGLILIPGYVIKFYQDAKREHTLSVSRLPFFFLAGSRFLILYSSPLSSAITRVRGPTSSRVITGRMLLFGLIR